LLTTLLALTVSACDSAPVSERRAIEIAEDAAADQMAALEDRVTDLEIQVAEQHQRINGVRALGLENADNAQRLVDTFNHNVRLENEVAVRRMTERGACGTRLVQSQAGVWVNERIPCTLADLRETE